MSSVRVVSDGTAFGTQVFANDVLVPVRSVRWAHYAGEAPTVVLEIDPENVDLVIDQAGVTVQTPSSNADAIRRELLDLKRRRGAPLGLA